MNLVDLVYVTLQSGYGNISACAIAYRELKYVVILTEKANHLGRSEPNMVLTLTSPNPLIVLSPVSEVSASFMVVQSS